MKRSLRSLVRATAAVALACSLLPSALSAGEYTGSGRYYGWQRYPGPGSYQSQQAPSAAPDAFAQRVLTSHNRERARMGLPPLRWNAGLSQAAGQWANSLARRGAFEHSDGRDDTGENLWMGTANGFSPEQMVGDFISERRAFRPGRFPNVSNTGNWSDVGHYTQIIWPETQDVGCALARNRGNDVLVCRYWPAGNVYGERVG